MTDLIEKTALREQFPAATVEPIRSVIDAAPTVECAACKSVDTCWLPAQGVRGHFACSDFERRHS